MNTTIIVEIYTDKIGLISKKCNIKFNTTKLQNKLERDNSKKRSIDSWMGSEDWNVINLCKAKPNKLFISQPTAVKMFITT